MVLFLHQCRLSFRNKRYNSKHYFSQISAIQSFFLNRAFFLSPHLLAAFIIASSSVFKNPLNKIVAVFWQAKTIAGILARITFRLIFASMISYFLLSVILSVCSSVTNEQLFFSQF